MTDPLFDLPKVELHCHLEGSMSSATVCALAEDQDVDWSWVWEGPISDHFSFADVPDFGRRYRFGLSLLNRDPALSTAVEALANTPGRSGLVRHRSADRTEHRQRVRHRRRHAPQAATRCARRLVRRAGHSPRRPLAER